MNYEQSGKHFEYIYGILKALFCIYAINMQFPKITFYKNISRKEKYYQQEIEKSSAELKKMVPIIQKIESLRRFSCMDCDDSFYYIMLIYRQFMRFSPLRF